MNTPLGELDKQLPLQAMVGHLNFSEGKPDARFQKNVSDAYEILNLAGCETPWTLLHVRLSTKLVELKESGAAAFRDTTQAEAVLSLAFQKMLDAYRAYHADLLFHLSDFELFQPFFIARVVEAVLSQAPPWGEEERIVAGSLKQLNDFVGYRPIAVLETRPRGEPYDHERVRPVPLYLRGAGVAWGRYHELIEQAIELLRSTDPTILADASFDLDLLDELAYDPRPFDHLHPATKRPNYVFGEWDPHHLDGQGRFRRYVVRQILLEALLVRVAKAEGQEKSELVQEAAAVLAGTMLMAMGMGGSGPATHDSTITLSTLVPRIARNRDAFYADLLKRWPGPHAEKLRSETAASRQPFSGARQHLNQYLAGQRAAQLQQRHLALLFAEMGFPDAARREANRLPAASARLHAEALGRLVTGRHSVELGRPREAARVLLEVESILHRGIGCGALADPWNVLGFQGMFPLFTAQEDSVRDHRLDELIRLVGGLLDLYARVLCESAAAGDQELVDELTPAMKRLAGWWDQYATVEVREVPRVHGGEAVTSAVHVASAMGSWHERGESAGDLSFWREQLEGFNSPKSFALVVDALLDKGDFRAAMALLMTWLGQVEQVPLEEGEYSFHSLALRWLLTATVPDEQAARPLIHKFLDYLEANAEEFWQVPVLEAPESETEEIDPKPEKEELFGAAYEDMSYVDSTDDDQEGTVADGGGPRDSFDLEEERENLFRRLRFLSTVARLWQIAGQSDAAVTEPGLTQILPSWLASAQSNYHSLQALLDAIHARRIPEPLGSYDSLVEHDRRRQMKEHLLQATIGTCLDTYLALGTLRVAVAENEGALEEEFRGPPWEPWAVQMEQAIFEADPAGAREALVPFLRAFQGESLVFTALSEGGHPRQILRARTAQTVLHALVSTLPRLGLIRETFHVLKTARLLERSHPTPGRGVSEFNLLFQTGYQESVRSLVEAAPSWGEEGTEDRNVVRLLEKITGPFLKLWVEHSQTLLLSVLETARGEGEWQRLGEFIRQYGHDLFHARFMTLANLRGILHRGVGNYLDYLGENPDPLHPVRLVEELGDTISREEAIRSLTVVLQAVVENYEEYKDYNTSTTLSDYGENLHVLLDFLRLKASYNRQAWNFRPLMLAHEVLTHDGREGAAVLWEGAFAQLAEPAARSHLDELNRLEKIHAIRLRTVGDRLQESFVKPLALDRLCALIGPSMEEASTGGGIAYNQMKKDMAAFAANPTGVGLDVPTWLIRLEEEVRQVQAGESDVAALAEEHFQLKSAPFSFNDLREQLDLWDQPLSEE